MKTCKLAALAASISLALGSMAVVAAPPTATQAPGQGAVASGSVGTVTLPSAGNNNTLTIPLTGNTVIDWGAASSTINPTGVAGFNIGQSATVAFTGNFGVLNIDVSGNPSQLYGALTGQGSVFVVNANGIIVGPQASISAAGTVGLLANTLGDESGFDGSPGSVVYDTTGGGVTVMQGAGINGADVLVSGGGTVNVDVGAMTATGAITLQAGQSNGVTSPATPVGASLVISGDNSGNVIFQSAGDASSSGTLTLGSDTTIAGTLINTGTMTFADAFTIDGALVNDHATMKGGGLSVTVGSFVNSGTFDGIAGTPLTTTAGGLTNSGQIINVNHISVTGGDLSNSGQITNDGNLGVTNGSLVNQGIIDLTYGIGVTGGDLRNQNQGSLTAPVGISVTNGSINNAGTITAGYEFETQSNASLGSFRAGADYSITNSGTIANIPGANSLDIDANSAVNQVGSDGLMDRNGSTGSFVNTGVLQVGESDQGVGLSVTADANIDLDGQLQFTNGSPASIENPLGGVGLLSTSDTGVVTVRVPIISGGAGFTGNQVVINADIDATGGVFIRAGNKPSNYTGHTPGTDYAVRIANGITVFGGTGVTIEGIDEGDADDHDPNMILQGTVEGDTVSFTGVDLYSGPNGKIVATGASPTVDLTFTGKLKTVPYLNDPGNFRYNYLQIVNAGSSALALTLNPVAYQTNGTDNGMSAVNILVDGDVALSQGGTQGYVPIGPYGSAITGALDLPNTHLVLQATGNISTIGRDFIGSGGAFFYWPGAVYIGTIASDANGAPEPGTLGPNTITLTSDFNNVLPGDISGASGIHFITQMPLSIANGATVVTNANAWINFGTDTLTQAYANGTLSPNTFYGGTQAGAVVTYGPLDASEFHTQVPKSDK